MGSSWGSKRSFAEGVKATEIALGEIPITHDAGVLIVYSASARRRISRALAPRSDF